MSKEVDKPGLLGKPGTAWHGCNFGCLMILILIVGVVLLVMM